jgi:hypothetical protein
VGDEEEAENKAQTSLRNAGAPDSARADEFIGGPTVGVSLESEVHDDGVLPQTRAPDGVRRVGNLSSPT